MTTVPDLDMEVELLDTEDAVELLSDLPYDSGLYVVSFQSGHGEYYDFLKRTAPIVAEPKPFEHFRGTNGGIKGYPLDSVISILKSDDTRDIFLTPLDRMPKWGDGSIHYTCRACHKPCVEEERTYDKGHTYHKECISN